MLGFANQRFATGVPNASEGRSAGGATHVWGGYPSVAPFIWGL